MPNRITPAHRIGDAVRDVTAALTQIAASVRIDAMVDPTLTVCASPSDAERLGSAHAAMIVARVATGLSNAMANGVPFATPQVLSRLTLENHGGRLTGTLHVFGVEIRLPGDRIPHALVQAEALLADGLVPPSAPALQAGAQPAAWVAEIVPPTPKHPARLKTRLDDAAAAFRILLWDEALEAHLSGAGPVRLRGYRRADGASDPEADGALRLAHCTASTDPVDRLIAACTRIEPAADPAP